MTTKNRSTVIAVFETRGRAESAIHELLHRGIPQDQIGIATPDKPLQEAWSPGLAIEENAADGAAAGALAGGAVGALTGAVLVGAIPGVGPVLAGGLLAGIAGGAAAGAAAGVYLGPFIALGLSEDEAREYEHELQQGRTVVTVQVDDNPEEALAIVQRHGGTARTVAEVPPA